MIKRVKNIGLIFVLISTAVLTGRFFLVLEIMIIYFVQNLIILKESKNHFTYLNHFMMK